MRNIQVFKDHLQSQAHIGGFSSTGKKGRGLAKAKYNPYKNKWNIDSSPHGTASVFYIYGNDLIVDTFSGIASDSLVATFRSKIENNLSTDIQTIESGHITPAHLEKLWEYSNLVSLIRPKNFETNKKDLELELQVRLQWLAASMGIDYSDACRGIESAGSQIWKSIISTVSSPSRCPQAVHLSICSSVSPNLVQTEIPFVLGDSIFAADQRSPLFDAHLPLSSKTCIVWRRCFCNGKCQHGKLYKLSRAAPSQIAVALNSYPPLCVEEINRKTKEFSSHTIVCDITHYSYLKGLL